MLFGATIRGGAATSTVEAASSVSNDMSSLKIALEIIPRPAYNDNMLDTEIFRVVAPRLILLWALMGAQSLSFAQTLWQPGPYDPRVGMNVVPNPSVPNFMAYGQPRIGIGGWFAQEAPTTNQSWTVLEVYPHSSFFGTEIWVRIRPDVPEEQIEYGDVWLKWKDNGKYKSYVPGLIGEQN